MPSLTAQREPSHPTLRIVNILLWIDSN